MSANTLLYTGLAAANYYNLTRDLSWMNSKNHEHSDRDGHVLGYICNIKYTVLKLMVLLLQLHQIHGK